MATCIAPFYVKNPLFPMRSENAQIPVPCGKCPSCLARRTSVWSFRLMQHDKIATSSFFITLTYENQHVNMTEKGFATLVKIDWQLFMKRLRKAQLNTGDERKIRYYAVGEYGTQTFRPHYHAIIFDVNETLIQAAWGLGIVDIQPVNEATVGYTCKYINKGKLIPVHKNDDRMPEFSLMSKGLGANYLTPEMVQYHKDDLSRTYATLTGGQKIALPRYLKNRIYTEQQRQLQSITFEQDSIQRAEKQRQEFHKTYGQNADYGKAQYERKKAAIDNFKNAQLEKRKKL